MYVLSLSHPHTHTHTHTHMHTHSVAYNFTVLLFPGFQDSVFGGSPFPARRKEVVAMPSPPPSSVSVRTEQEDGVREEGRKKGEPKPKDKGEVAIKSQEQGTKSGEDGVREEGRKKGETKPKAREDEVVKDQEQGTKAGTTTSSRESKRHGGKVDGLKQLEAESKKLGSPHRERRLSMPATVLQDRKRSPADSQRVSQTQQKGRAVSKEKEDFLGRRKGQEEEEQEEAASPQSQLRVATSPLNISISLSGELGNEGEIEESLDSIEGDEGGTPRGKEEFF